MPAAAPAYNTYNNYYNGHEKAELVYAPYHNDATYGPLVHRIHKRSPGVLITSKLASLSAIKGLLLAKAAGLGGATVIGKKKAAFKSAKTLKALSTLAFVGR